MPIPAICAERLVCLTPLPNAKFLVVAEQHGKYDDGSITFVDRDGPLMRESGMLEDWISQVTEALVLNEVCDSWGSASIY